MLPLRGVKFALLSEAASFLIKLIASWNGNRNLF